MVLKVYRFQKRAFYLRSMELTDVSIHALLSHWQNKINKMMFSTEDLVLIKILRQEKVTTIDE